MAFRCGERFALTQTSRGVALWLFTNARHARGSLWNTARMAFRCANSLWGFLLGFGRHWPHLSSFKGQPTRSYVRSPRSFVRRNVDNRLGELVSKALGSFCCALGLGPPNLTT